MCAPLAAAAYLWDLGTYFLVCLACLLVFALYGEPSFVGTPSQTLAIFCVLWFYGVSVLPLVYCYSFLFDNATVGQISIIMFNLVAAFVMVVAHLIMSDMDNTRDVDAVLVNFWSCSPAPHRPVPLTAPSLCAHRPRTTYHVPRTTYHVSRATCHVPRTTYHVPRTTYHVPRTTCHVPRATYHVPRTTYNVESDEPRAP